MRAAFKEWAVVVDALGRGEQTIILRKGGISEGRGGFQPEHREFLLFPTLFHQQRESVLPAAQQRYDAISPAFPPRDILRLEYFARVSGWEKIESATLLHNLRGHHIWREEIIQERFDWTRHKHIYCLFVRTCALPKPVELQMLPDYGGCKSWIMLEEDVSVEGAKPVLSDEQFSARIRQLEEALHVYKAA
jgi:hypothetical protein